MTDLKTSGVGSLTTLVVGVLAWVGSEVPTADALAGADVVEQGLTRIEIFTRGKCTITGTCPVGANPWPSSYRDFGVGTKTSVWGWRAAVGRVGGGE